MLKLFILIISLMLTGCGFHLRGPRVLHEPLRVVYLKTQDPYGLLAHNLRLSLKLSKVILVDRKEDATAVLAILNEKRSNRLIGISGTQETRQYNLTLTVTFQVRDPLGHPLISPQWVSENRILTIKSGQMLAGSNEERALYQQMQQAIVYDMMLRLSSHLITQELTKPSIIHETHATETEGIS